MSNSAVEPEEKDEKALEAGLNSASKDAPLLVAEGLKKIYGKKCFCKNEWK